MEAFIDLQLTNIVFLFIVGFIGGMVSGFIGSGGAFVLTPAMMSMGVPAQVAVASNMAHKFPKALVATIKRARFGQVDIKLGIIMGIFAELGVMLGASIMKMIKATYGDAGTNLYVSVIFVIILAIVGGWVLYDSWKLAKLGDHEEKTPRLAKWIQSIKIPYTMMYFKSIKAEVSVLFIIPIGFATGMLAASIAVGGFIGVPAMMYVLGVPALMATATELLIAFVMGMGGSISYAWSGFVDIRLAMIILAGSLFGVQIGAIGTTYVKPYTVKLVMGVIMVVVLFSRFFYLPGYLSSLQLIDPVNPQTIALLDSIGFYILVLALALGAVIILGALYKGIHEHRQRHAMLADQEGLAE